MNQLVWARAEVTNSTSLNIKKMYCSSHIYIFTTNGIDMITEPHTDLKFFNLIKQLTTVRIEMLHSDKKKI